MVSKNTLVTGAAVAVSVASLGFAGASLASAEDADTATPSAGSTDSREGRECGAGGPRDLTEVTGEEATRVTDAVAAQDSAFTAESVGKDSEGNYVVRGTKDGGRAMARVSADLSSVEVGTGRGGGPGGRGGHDHTEVTGDEATRVTEAVTAQDAGITVESVLKDPDGSYDVVGTKDGARVRVEVSADLATVEVREARDRGGRGPGSGSTEESQTSQSPSPTTTPSVRIVPSQGTSPADLPAA